MALKPYDPNDSSTWLDENGNLRPEALSAAQNAPIEGTAGNAARDPKTGRPISQIDTGPATAVDVGTEGIVSRGKGNVNPAAPGGVAPVSQRVNMQPTPEQTAAAKEVTRNTGQTASWDGTQYVFSGVDARAGGGTANATSAGLQTGGVSPLSNDILRRQTSGPTAPTLRSPTAVTQAAQPAASIPVGTTRGEAFATPFALPARAVTAARPNDPIAQRAAAVAQSTAAKPAQSGLTQTGDQVKQTLGVAPTIDMGLADRGQNTVQDALGLSQQVVNSALAPVSDNGLAQATADARSVLDRLLNGPNTADRIGSQTLRSQLALARSAAGGPGAVQEALRNQQFAAPELEAQAAQQGTAETLQRTQAAGNVAAGLQNTAIGAQQNETQRIQAASGAASGFAQGALGARGQDIQIAQANQGAATSLLNNITELTGQTLNIDQKNQELIGQMFRDAAALNFDWAKLSAEDQEKAFDRYVEIYHIDTAAAAQVKAAMLQAAAGKKGFMDYAVPIVGAGATVASTALSNRGSGSSNAPSGTSGPAPAEDVNASSGANEDAFWQNGGV